MTKHHRPGEPVVQEVFSKRSVATLKAVDDRGLNFLVGVPESAFVARTRIPSNREYRTFLREIIEASEAIVDRLASGEIDAREFGEQLFEILERGHSLSWMLGRQRSGSRLGFNEFDALAGNVLAARDGEFILGFIDDLAAFDPRYYETVEDKLVLRQKPVQARTDLYANSVRGSANEAFVEAGPADALYDWILGVNENHCSDCPRIARRSPYSKDANVGHPGNGQTECLGNCLCVWRRRTDGRMGFKPVRRTGFQRAA